MIYDQKVANAHIWEASTSLIYVLISGELLNNDQHHNWFLNQNHFDWKTVDLYNKMHIKSFMNATQTKILSPHIGNNIIKHPIEDYEWDQ